MFEFNLLACSFSGVYGHLGSLVHTNPMVQEYLGPSLLSTYIAVDQIEGLDVDKEEFDKYGARWEGLRVWLINY